MSTAHPSPAFAQNASAKIDPALFVGTYDGGQTEIAADLELGADGRFRYGLSYGALDEEARGSWSVDDHAVLLTSDPVTPPRIILLGQANTTVPQIAIELEVPEGLSRQYFHAEIELADGTMTDRQFRDDEGSLTIDMVAHPKSVTLTLSIAALRSEVVQISSAGGQAFHFRYEPNDIGKIAFLRTALRNDNGELILRRHGRNIRFKPRRGFRPEQP